MENFSDSIEWKIPFKSPSKKLFLVEIFLLILLLIYTFSQKEYFFAFLLFIIFFGLLVLHFFQTSSLKVSLDKEKLHLNDDSFSLSNFSSFAIFESNDNFYLKLYPKSRFSFSKEILLPKEKSKIEKIKAILKEKLEEKEGHSSLIEEFLRYLGF